ncbi:MAG: dienelactone hydrolase family protein [Sandaracinus sp.]|nr:dienelactone hydrolase family protein [Sandaracinus sp.]
MRITTSMGWVLLALAACAPDDSCDDARFDEVGPYASGVTTLDVDGVLVEVWYPASLESTAGLARDVYDMRDTLPADTRATIPADAPTTYVMDAYRDVPVASGSFPVVYFSHGLGGFRLQSTAITTHLARWGYVVVAPEHAERNLEAVLLATRGEGAITDEAVDQITAAHARMQTENEAGGFFAGNLDLSRVAIGGHSAGGGAVQVLVDDGALGVTSWFGLATVAAPLRSTTPGVMLGGTVDTLATERAMTDLWTNRTTASSGAFVEIANAGHLAFTDICLIGRERGGVLQIAQDAGLELDDLIVQLATDGCQQGALPAEQSWPVTRHYLVAHLRATLGAPGEGLDDSGLYGVDGCFDGLVASVSER